MFEARFAQAGLLKKILDSLKDLVTEANFDCSATGIALQAMDSSHVSLVSLLIRKDGFDRFVCDRPLSLGINLTSMAKILKCAGNDDTLTLKVDNTDSITFMFESPKQDKISEFELRLLSIDSEHLSIPDTDYTAVVKMPALEFQKICRDLRIVGDTVTLSTTKAGLKFSVGGELGTGNITVKPGSAADKAEETSIHVSEPVQLTFALHYLSSFAKATSLSSTVTLSMSKDIPLVVEYRIEDMGYLRFFLAPKVEEDEG